MFFQIANLNENDLSIIQNQLKRTDPQIKGVVERCRYKNPRIVLLNPIKEEDENDELNYQALSNLMWLTCPYLNDKIHELETQGVISRITNFIQHDSTLRSMMRSAHANFYFLRNFIFFKYAQSSIMSKPEGVFKNGIGGIRNLETLKCLHIHFCHYRIFNNNIAGLLTCNLLNGKLDCDEDICGNLCQ